MRTRTDTIVFRLGFTLAMLVLIGFVALVGGVVLGVVVAQATRRPCGALIGRLVASV